MLRFGGLCAADPRLHEVSLACVGDQKLLNNFAVPGRPVEGVQILLGEDVGPVVLGVDNRLLRG